MSAAQKAPGQYSPAQMAPASRSPSLENMDPSSSSISQSGGVPQSATVLRERISIDCASGRYKKSLEVVFDLGRWTIAGIEETQANLISLDGPSKVAAWCRQLSETPFGYESDGLTLGRNELLARLRTFDCITFIYNVLALAFSVSFQDYVRILGEIRYKSFYLSKLDNRRIAGNFYDFACEALLANAVQLGYLEDVTEHVASVGALKQLEMRLRPLKRKALNDAKESIVYPRQSSETRIFSYIDCQHEIPVRDSQIREGDIILLTNAPQQSQPACFVNHAGVAHRKDGVLSMVHSSRHYITRAQPSQGYVQQGERWHPGVYHLGQFLGEGSLVVDNNVKYYGYDGSKVRSLTDYARENFAGLKILRPAERPVRHACSINGTRSGTARNAVVGERDSV